MPTNRKVIDFKIHNLTEEQFQELKEAGQIDPNAIYCTPDETVANFEAVNARIDETNKNLNTFESGVNETVGVINTTIVNVDKKVDEAIQTEQQHNIEINARVDETVANFEEINTEIEALKDKGGVPLLTPMWADHTLNDMSWLNADNFTWQSGDVYVAAYEHLASEAIFESETKKYVRVKTLKAAHDGWREDNNIYYREPSYDFTSGEEQYEGYIFAWVATGSDGIVVTNTETPAESDVVHYYSKMYPEEPSPSEGRVIEAGEETFYSNAETETIDGITITFCRAEDGHKICPAGQEANVQALYEKTGVAWYYIIDEANKRFKLPRTKFGFTGLRDSVGGYVEAGLPNIIAEFAQYTPNVDNLPVGRTYGAAYGKEEKSVKTYSAPIIDSGSGNTLVGFDASRSSSVYGNNHTVQPRATQMYLYFYVGNFERDALEQTAGITSEQLNNKADADLSNTQFSLLKNNNGALSWNDINMSAMCMPSDKYKYLSVGSSGSQYTAPADGWFYYSDQANGAGVAEIANTSTGIRIRSTAPVATWLRATILPVKNGDVVILSYENGGNSQIFRFIYAEGVKHLAQ